MTPDSADKLVDGIYRLMDAVFWGETDAHAFFKWSVRHAGHGDPLPEAWSLCADSQAMRDVVWTLEGDAAFVPGRLATLLRCTGCVAMDETPAQCADCCRMVRLYKKTLTIAEVVAWAKNEPR